MSYTTSHTILQRALSLEDDEAWKILHERYSKFIYYVVSSMGIDHSDQEDITQLIFFKLTSKLSLYNKERGLFRTWLKQVVRNTVLNYFKQKQSKHRTSLAYQHKHELNAPPSIDHIDDWVENEWKDYILNLALHRLEARTNGNGIRVLRMNLQGISISEMKKRTGLATNTLYTLKKRYKKLLIHEVRSLQAELEGRSNSDAT